MIFYNIVVHYYVFFTTSKLPLNLHPLYRISDLNLVVAKINQVAAIMETVVELNAVETMAAVTIIPGNAEDVSEMKLQMIRQS